MRIAQTLVSRGFLVAVLATTAAACGGGNYSMNLARKTDVGGQVRALVAQVESDRPPKWESKSSAFRKYVFQTSLTGTRKATLSSFQQERYSKIREKQWKRVRRSSYSVSYRTRFQGRPVIHQITAGVIDIPLRTLRSRWYVPSEWGRNLSGYKGGSLVIDRADERGRTTLQRERMVLGTPWYAIGAPDLDMSKYEVVDYKENQMQISWIVSESANRSVQVDVGYLRLCDFFSDGRPQTLAIFNSVHKIDPGWLGGFTPGLVEDNLRQAFRDHLSNYRRVASRLLRDARAR